MPGLPAPLLSERYPGLLCEGQSPVGEQWCEGSRRDDWGGWSQGWIAGGAGPAPPFQAHDEAEAAGQVAALSKSAWAPPQEAGVTPATLDAGRQWGSPAEVI